MQYVSLFFALSGAAAAVAGIACLLAAARPSAPTHTLRSRLLNSRLRESLDRQLRVERFIYRHHRLSGSAIIAGALTLLVVLGTAQARWFDSVWFGGYGGYGGKAAVLVAWLLAIAVLVIGIIVLVRPSALKGFEALANRWVQLSPATLLTSRQIGILLLVVGIACLGAAARIAGA